MRSPVWRRQQTFELQLTFGDLGLEVSRLASCANSSRKSVAAVEGLVAAKMATVLTSAAASISACCAAIRSLDAATALPTWLMTA